jgi:hypothetical protein
LCTRQSKEHREGKHRILNGFSASTVEKPLLMRLRTGHVARMETTALSEN